MWLISTSSVSIPKSSRLHRVNRLDLNESGLDWFKMEEEVTQSDEEEQEEFTFRPACCSKDRFCGREQTGSWPRRYTARRKGNTNQSKPRIRSANNHKSELDSRMQHSRSSPSTLNSKILEIVQRTPEESSKASKESFRVATNRKAAADQCGLAE